MPSSASIVAGASGGESECVGAAASIKWRQTRHTTTSRAFLANGGTAKLYQHLRAGGILGHLGIEGEKHVTRRVLGAGFPQPKTARSSTGPGVETGG